MLIVTESIKNLPLPNIWLESGSCYYHHMYTICDYEDPLPHPTLDYQVILLI